jgi:hypothetical protein
VLIPGETRTGSVLVARLRILPDCIDRESARIQPPVQACQLFPIGKNARLCASRGSAASTKRVVTKPDVIETVPSSRSIRTLHSTPAREKINKTGVRLWTACSGRRELRTNLSSRHRRCGYFFGTRAFSSWSQGRTTVRMSFIRFRELTSARGNALLQLFSPVENHFDA